MPRISDLSLKLCVSIYDTKSQAETDEPCGGSGFLVSMTGPTRVEHVYVVTCEHVIRGLDRAYVRFNTKDGGSDIQEIAKERWSKSLEADLAICRVDLVAAHDFKCQGRADFLSDEKRDAYNIGVGDDVFMVGRFLNIRNKQRNDPVMRFGNIAAFPQEPVPDEAGFERESVLVEMRSRSGFSGSPVYVYIAPATVRMDFQGTMSADEFYGPFLLGIEWGQVMHPDEKFARRVGASMLGVVPVQRLSELLDSERLLSERHFIEEALADCSSAATERAVLEPEPPTTGEDSQHKERFNRMLNAAVQKPTQGGGT